MVTPSVTLTRSHSGLGTTTLLAPRSSAPLPSPPLLHLPCRGRRRVRLRAPLNGFISIQHQHTQIECAQHHCLSAATVVVQAPVTRKKTMDADAAATPCMKPASHSLPLPPPPALFAVRARSRVAADVGVHVAAFSGPPDTPPRRSPVTVPFLWEDAPGKPKAAAASPTACAAAAATATTPAAATNAGHVPDGDSGGGGGYHHQDSGGHAEPARPMPMKLKLPPRLQQVPAPPPSSFAAAADTPLSSPKTVLLGPYYACAGGSGRSRPPRWARSGGGAAAFRRTTSAGVGLFSRTWSRPKSAPPPPPPPPPGSSSKNRGGGDHEPDAPWCSPASSSTTSSSSVSTWFGGDDNSRGRLADGREVSSEDDDGSPRGRGSVTITRFRRNRSLPSITTSNLWASIRRRSSRLLHWS